MANYKLGPVIGKIGGGEVVTEPFSVQWAGSGDTQEDRPIHTVEGGPDQDYLVAVIGEYQNNSNLPNNQSEVYVGSHGTIIHPDMRGKTVALSFVVSRDDTIMMKKRAGQFESVSFSGHAYVVPLPT